MLTARFPQTIVALADAPRVRQLRGVLAQDDRLEAFTSLGGCLRWLADRRAPVTGLVIAKWASLEADEGERRALSELPPACARLFWSETGTLDEARQVVEHGSVERILRPDADAAELGEALAALRRARALRREERLRFERLDFEHDVLQETVALLEERVEAVCHEAQLATVYGLARLAEHRDNTTGRHLERVSAYSRELAEQVRDAGLHADVLTRRFIEDLALSAPLHDIGKVAVPDAVLMKPSQLTEAEWVVMRSHARLGAEVLESVLADTGGQGYLRMGQEIAHCHHECWDGSGYPRGLQADEIPLSARIMAIADVYDALTSVRPYKRAWSHAEAVAHVTSLAGSQFDPELTRVFERNAQRFEALRVELADAAPLRIAV